MTTKSLPIDTSEVRLPNIIKAELRKAIDNQVAKIIILVTLALTLVMFVASILRFENIALQTGANEILWIEVFSAISNPAAILLAIIFILLVCEEWTRGTALITYTFVPQRNRIVLGKFIALLLVYVATVIILFTLSALASIIASGVHSLTISWSAPIQSVLFLPLPLLVNLLLGFAMAIVTREKTLAIVLFFLVPPATVMASLVSEIEPIVRWFSLEHSSSIFIFGSADVGVAQYISSIVIWIAIPCVIGAYRNIKIDLS